MSFTGKLIQSRPSTSVDFFSPTSEVIARIDELKAQGKIISYNLNQISADNLIKTMQITYDTIDSHNLIVQENIFIDSANSRTSHCAENGISFSVETE